MEILKKIYPHIRDSNDKENCLTPETLYYINVFERFEKDKHYSPKWNWSAAILGGLWLAYRRMYAYAFFLGLFQIALHVSIDVLFQPQPSYQSAFYFAEFTTLSLIMGFYGNYLYIKFIRHEIANNIFINHDAPNDLLVPKSGTCGFLGIVLFIILSTIGYFTITSIALYMFCAGGGV